MGPLLKVFLIGELFRLVFWRQGCLKVTMPSSCDKVTNLFLDCPIHLLLIPNLVGHCPEYVTCKRIIPSDRKKLALKQYQSQLLNLMLWTSNCILKPMSFKTEYWKSYCRLEQDTMGETHSQSLLCEDTRKDHCFSLIKNAAINITFL